MEVERRAVKRNLADLIDCGYDIGYTKSVRVNKKGEQEILYSNWYLKRDFSDAELRLLIDSILFSKHISSEQSKKLAKKLEGLSSKKFKAKVSHIHTIKERLLCTSDLFATIGALDEAISKSKHVEFTYGKYGIDKKRHKNKNEDGTIKKYRVIPHQMVATNGRYYLICTSENREGLTHFRVDRIMSIKLLPEPVQVLLRKSGKGTDIINLSNHMTANIYMYHGEFIRVKFRINKKLVADVLDWFGDEADLKEEEDSSVIVRVKVNEQSMIYWLLQYGKYVEILYPESLRGKLIDTIKEIAEKYYII
jgi:predicted DNA-binding transcriptional regulator YafY